MTPHQVDLVQASFEKVVPHKELAAKMFYGRLFEIAPQVRPMFKDDVTEQGRKLMAALTLVVNGLTNLDVVVPVAKKLAVGHLSYGVKADHYQPVGEALIWTLEQALGEDFTSETRDAWTSAYTTLAQVMISEAYGHAVA